MGKRFDHQKVTETLDESKIPVLVSASEAVPQGPQAAPDSTQATKITAVKDKVADKVAQLSAAEQKQWQIFQEILKSKNDSDPRLDKDLHQLSDGLHQVLREKYQQLPAENRNERGLITYLLARDLKNIEDLDFLKAVYEEAPCLSLENCGVRSNSDPHLSGIDQTSMNYPQLAALYQLEKQIENNPGRFQDTGMRDHMRALINQAKQFGVPIVRNKAEELAGKFSF